MSRGAKARAYQKAVRARGRKILDALKDMPCKDCGVKYPPYVMDFDHKRDKKFNISAFPGKPVAALLAEAAKCDVVCANCHRLRTHGAGPFDQ